MNKQDKEIVRKAYGREPSSYEWSLEEQFKKKMSYNEWLRFNQESEKYNKLNNEVETKIYKIS